MPSIAQDLEHTNTAQWLCAGRAQQDEWDIRRSCFDAFADVLSPYRTARPDGRWSQSGVNPPGLLKAVALGAHFASSSVFNRWTAKQNGNAIKRWAGSDPRLKPREAFVAEAKIVSFWPYRQGAIAVADVFEMSLAEIAASYMRALGAWACNNPVLAACVPAGPPLCVAEDMAVLAHRRPTRLPMSSTEIAATAAELASLPGILVAAVLDDASLTPLGAFNVIREDMSRLLSDTPEPLAVKVVNILSELADQLLHCREGERVLTRVQAQQLSAEMTGVSALLGKVADQ